MGQRRNGDASFLIGLVLGMFVGAAIVVVLSPLYEDTRKALTEQAERARRSLESRAAGMGGEPAHG
jgi:uncharacterized membrane-anchored protein YhcB (DUF1043 family)